MSDRGGDPVAQSGAGSVTLKLTAMPLAAAKVTIRS
jgi:hypothetical protein